MEYEISSGALTARVAAQGAQLVSLRYKDREYLYQADADWPRHAPLCCPYCGAVEGGSFRHGGAEYAAPRHGFVRDGAHTLAERSESALSFAFELGPGDSRWPWPFALRQDFTAAGARLTHTARVTNTGSEPMPLQIGFHPGFIAPAGSVITAGVPELPGGVARLAVSEGLFDNDSYQLNAPASAAFRLERGDGGSVTVDVAGWPYVLLWGAPGLTSYVCIEPWSGAPGPGALEERPGAVLLAPGASFEKTLSISLE